MKLLVSNTEDDSFQSYLENKLVEIEVLLSNTDKLDNQSVKLIKAIRTNANSKQFWKHTKRLFLPFLQNLENHLINLDISQKIKETFEDIRRQLKHYSNLRIEKRNNLLKSEEFKRYSKNKRKEYWDNIENREAQSQRKKIYFSDPENKEKLRKISQEYWNKPENKEKLRKISQEYWNKPENREKMSAITKEYFLNNPDFMSEKVKLMRSIWNKPENKDKQSEILKEFWNDPEIKEDFLKELKVFYSLPENQGYGWLVMNKKFLLEWWSVKSRRDKLSFYFKKNLKDIKQ